MKLTEKSKNSINDIGLITGISYEQSKDFFDSLLFYIVLNYLENKPTILPYIGEFKLIHNGDIITTDGRIANISIEYVPDDSVKKIIGQISDKENIVEIEEFLKSKIKNELEETVYETKSSTRNKQQ